MDNGNKNKYLDDEQVKKNIELFNDDREKFLKEANQLDFKKTEEKIEKEEKTNINKKNIGEPANKNININEAIFKIDLIIISAIILYGIYICFLIKENNICDGLFGGLSSSCRPSSFYILTMISAPFWTLIIIGDKVKNKLLKILVTVLLLGPNIGILIITDNHNNSIYQIANAYLFIPILILINEIIFKIIKNTT